MTERLRVGIVGAGGYTGSELVRLVHAHPLLQLVWVGAREKAGRLLGDVLPSVLGVEGLEQLRLETFEPEDAPGLAAKLDVVFTALPHAASARAVQALHATTLRRVVDLSADFRLRDPTTYERTYGAHPCPELVRQAVYGIPELYRSELASARLIAAPGCYPTSAILPLWPLLDGGLIESRGIIVDSKSGVSGAGRTPGPSTHFSETGEGIRPYKIAGAHRHISEIEQELGRAAGGDVRVVFTPHLVPMTRGILTTAYARPKSGVNADACRAAARAKYGAGGLVTVLDDGRVPDTLWVRGSARAQLAYALDERTGVLLALCALDNLARGASAQAVQALNVSLGWPEALGLPEIATFP